MRKNALFPTKMLQMTYFFFEITGPCSHARGRRRRWLLRDPPSARDCRDADPQGGGEDLADGLKCERGQDWVRAEVCFIHFDFFWGEGKEFECEKQFILLMKDHGAGAGGLSLGENLNTY